MGHIGYCLVHTVNAASQLLSPFFGVKMLLGC